MGSLWVSGTTSRLDCSRQLRRCVAQLGLTVGVVKPIGGMNTWKRPLLPSGMLSNPGRLLKALGHHTRSLGGNPDVGDRQVKNDAGEMSMSEDSKQKVWLEHYQRLLNAEFDWDQDHLSYQPPVKGPPIPITIDMVKKAISQMKVGKAPGPSGIVVEMIRAAGDMGASMICDLAAAIIRDGKVPSDWEQSFIVCLYK